MLSTEALFLYIPVGITTTILLLVSLWAGLSRRHWFLRASVICLSIAALYPIRAFEPMVWFGIAMPITAWMSRLTWGRRRSATPAGENEPQVRRKPIQFRLVDFLLVMLLVSVVLAFVAGLRGEQVAIQWQFGGSVLCIVVVAQLCLAVTLAKRWRRWLAVIGLFAAIILSSVFNARVLLGSPLSDFFFAAAFLESYEHFLFASLFLFSLASFLLLVLLLSRSLIPLPVSASSWRKSFTIFARVTLACLSLIVLVPMLMLYVRMWEGPRIPEDPYAGEPNGFPRAIGITPEIVQLNPNQLTFRSFQSVSSAQRTERLKQLNAELLSLLEIPGHILFDFQKDANLDYMNVTFIESDLARNEARMLDAEAESYKQAGRFDEASNYSLAAMRLGNSMSRGGLLVHWLVGVAVESIGSHGMMTVRDDVTMAQARRLLIALQEIEQSREPLATIAVRDAAYDDRAYDWISRLPRAIASLQGDESEKGAVTTSRGIENRRDAELRMLIADFGIRLYQAAHGRLPDDLAELVPELIESVPIDPFSGNPLIYRKNDQAWSLYSTGPDGQDDGGRFGPYDEAYFNSGYDFDLEIMTR